MTAPTLRTNAEVRRSFDSFMHGYAPNGYSFSAHNYAIGELRDAITTGDASSAWLWGRVIARFGRWAISGRSQ